MLTAPAHRLSTIDFLLPAVAVPTGDAATLMAIGVR
jgi:hypothetical protein